MSISCRTEETHYFIPQMLMPDTEVKGQFVKIMCVRKTHRIFVLWARRDIIFIVESVKFSFHVSFFLFCQFPTKLGDLFNPLNINNNIEFASYLYSIIKQLFKQTVFLSKSFGIYNNCRIYNFIDKLHMFSSTYKDSQNGCKKCLY